MDPKRAPSLLHGSPTQDCSIGLVHCQVRCQPAAPGHPLTAGQEGPGVRRRAANCLSPRRPTVRQERPKSHSGNSGLAVKAWPAVTLKGPGASQKSTDGRSGDNWFCYPDSFHLCPGRGASLSNSRSSCFSGLEPLPGCKDRPHDSGLVNRCDWFPCGHVTRIEPVWTNQSELALDDLFSSVALDPERARSWS